MKARIVQLLCPSRHCLVAAVYDSEDGESQPSVAAGLRESFDAAVAAGVLKPWCDICLSRDLRCEDMPTRFRTKAEAAPFLKESERQQAATREYLKAGKN